jgi:hypothetical protein
LYSYSELPRREYNTGKPSKIPTIAPAIVKFTPEVKESRPISVDEIENWLSHPDELVGNCFISKDMVQRVFIVDDYFVKQKTGPQYDVLYEDLGLNEVQAIDPGTMLEMLTEAELVVNAL